MTNELDYGFREVPVEDWRAFQPEKAVVENPQGNIVLFRKKGNNVAYREVKGGYLCNGCGTTIITEKVAHPIHHGPFDGAGTGKCFYESVPYCPKCEEKPNFHGTPIRSPRKSASQLLARLK